MFAVAAAVTLGLWTVFNNQASDNILPAFGAVLVSFTAVFVGSMFLMPKLRSAKLFTHWKGILFAVLAGAFAFGSDYLSLKTFASGVDVSVGGPIIIGGSVAVAAVIGFFLGEAFTTMKFLGLLLVIVGAGILSALG